MTINFRNVEHAARESAQAFIDELQRHFDFDFIGTDPMGFNEFQDQCIEYVDSALSNFVRKYKVTMSKKTIVTFEIYAEDEDDIYDTVYDDPHDCDDAEDLQEDEEPWEFDEIEEI